MKDKRFNEEGKPRFSICHTSARPNQWFKMCETWISRAYWKDQLEYVLSFDHGRADFNHELYRAHDKYTDIFRHTMNRGRKNNVDGWNAAVAVAKGAILILASDDIIPPLHWDKRIVETLIAADKFPLSDEFVIDVSSGTKADERGLMVLGIFSRARYERLGYALFPAYESMYSDDDFSAHARQDGVVIAAKDLLFEHLHPSNGTAEMDLVYQANNSPMRYHRGREIFERRKRAKFNGLGDQRIRIGVCLPGETFRWEWVCQWTGLYRHLIALGYEVGPAFAQSSNVFITRSILYNDMVAADPKPDFILWIDDDQLVNPAAFDQLMDDMNALPEADMVAGWTWIPDPNQVRISCGKMGADDEEVTTVPLGEMREAMERKAILEVEWTGFPAVLMRYRALELAGEKPFRPMEAPRSVWGHAGEDVAFCARLRSNGGRIFVDSRVFLPHLKMMPFTPSIVTGERTPLKDVEETVLK